MYTPIGPTMPPTLMYPREAVQKKQSRKKLQFFLIYTNTPLISTLKVKKWIWKLVQGFYILPLNRNSEQNNKFLHHCTGKSTKLLAFHFFFTFWQCRLVPTFATILPLHPLVPTCPTPSPPGWTFPPTGSTPPPCPSCPPSPASRRSSGRC